MSHTPGPWIIAHGTIGRMKGHNVAAARGSVLVAFTHGINEGSTANARLIATAPEMLALLRQHFESWYAKASNIRKIEPAWVPATRALLAKIEGKESP